MCLKYKYPKTTITLAFTMKYVSSTKGLAQHCSAYRDNCFHVLSAKLPGVEVRLVQQRLSRRDGEGPR